MSTSPSPTKKTKAGKTILVTGGTGLVGMGIQEALQTRKRALKQPDEEWIFLSSKDCDLLSMDKTRELFRTRKPTHVIHLAAKVFVYSPFATDRKLTQAMKRRSLCEPKPKVGFLRFAFLHPTHIHPQSGSSSTAKTPS